MWGTLVRMTTEIQSHNYGSYSIGPKIMQLKAMIHIILYAHAIYAGQPLATTLGIIIDPAIAQNQVPEGQNADANFVSGVPGPEHSSIKILLLLFVLIFIIILH